MDFSTDQEFLNRIRRHFVCLSGVWVELDRSGNWKTEEKPYCYSGFIIKICGRWCFMTAGHVFRDIDNFIAKGSIRLLKCGLADYFSAEAKVKEPVQFAYDDAHRIIVDRSEMDFGLIPLRDYYTMNLEANGVTPMRVAAWTGRRPPQFDFYAVLGLPDEHLEPRSRMGERGPQIGYIMTLSLVGVQPLESPPADSAVSPIPRFAGALRDGGCLGSVKGMSGGPILGISKTDGGWDYACVAVQGSWDKGRRLIYGTPVSIVVETITKLLTEKPRTAGQDK
jgi:hypothetical protein